MLDALSASPVAIGEWRVRPDCPPGRTVPDGRIAVTERSDGVSPSAAALSRLAP